MGKNNEFKTNKQTDKNRLKLFMKGIWWKNVPEMKMKKKKKRKTENHNCQES